MAIADYSELILAIGEYVNRTDLVDVAPRFIALAETKLNRRLRFRDQEIVLSATPDVNGVVPLPSDFLEVRAVMTTGSPPRILHAVGPDIAAGIHTAGLPIGFIIAGENLFLEPASQTPVFITYYRSIPPLTEAAPTNWLLSKHPDIYIYASAFEAFTYLRDADGAALAAGLLNDSVRAADRANQMSRYATARVRFAVAPP